MEKILKRQKESWKSESVLRFPLQRGVADEELPNCEVLFLEKVGQVSMEKQRLLQEVALLLVVNAACLHSNFAMTALL